MAMSGRKKITSHTHTDAEIKQAAQYQQERAPQTGTPASEIIMDADAESTRTLDAVNEDTISIAIVPETAPSENLLVNSGFERDVNADGVPDNWTLYQQIGTGSLILDTTDGVKGKQCLKVTADTTASTIWAMSEFFTVNQLKRYFIEAWYKCERANNADVSIVIYYYRADKTTLNEMDYVITHGNGLTTWQKFSKVSTSTLATSKYGRILLGVKTPTVAPSYILFDDIICSLQRAVSPTAGIVASTGGTVMSPPTVTCGYAVWTLGSDAGTTRWTVPSADTEEYFVQLNFWLSSAVVFLYRIYDETAGVYYPYNSVSDATHQPALLGTQATGIITIPNNVNGHILRLDIYIQTGGSSVNVGVYRATWGHSPHQHQ